MMVTQIASEAKSSPTSRIYDEDQNLEYLEIPDFSETLYYDVRFDLPEHIIRNKRDSRFYPGTKPAGVKGITKKLLYFIQKRVNPLGFVVNGEGKSEARDIFEEGYEKSIEYTIENDVHEEESGFFLDFGDE